jgi:hypothetical protein
MQKSNAIINLIFIAANIQHSKLSHHLFASHSFQFLIYSQPLLPDLSLNSRCEKGLFKCKNVQKCRSRLHVDWITLSDDRITLSNDRITLSNNWITLSDDRITLSDAWITLSNDRITLSDDRITLSNDRITLSDDRITLSNDWITLYDDNVS